MPDCNSAAWPSFWRGRTPPPAPEFTERLGGRAVEEALVKVKAALRKFEVRTREALVEAMGRALDALTARDVRGYFEHCGYRVAGQFLCRKL